MKCPTCQSEFKRGASEFPPFCSERCKLIDLSHWLNEDYRIPGDPASPADLTGLAESDDESEN